MSFVTLLLVISEDTSAQYGSREGFFLSFGPSAGYEFTRFERPVFGGAIRIGSGLNDRCLLYYQNRSAVTLGKPENLSGYDIFILDDNQIAMSYLFFSKRSSPYIFGALGFVIAIEALKENEASYRTDTAVGFSSALGGGHEWRLSEKFSLAPEIEITYNRTGYSDSIRLSAALNGIFYF